MILMWVAAFMYVLVPMPYLFFGTGQSSGYNSSLASGWAQCMPAWDAMSH